MKRIVLLVCLIYGVSTVHGQVLINGYEFKSNLEIAEAQISDETIMLSLFEIDKFNPKYEMDNCTDCSDGKSIVMDIDFNRGFKFPIKETDSVFIRLSNLQQGLAKYQHNKDQIDKSKKSINQPETNQLKNNAEAIKAKGIEIAKLMQEGKLSPQEAEKQLLALTQSFNQDFDQSSIANITTDKFEESPTYAFSFYNDKTLTETQPFSGYLWIKTFNKNQFIAEFGGEYIENCVEKRAAKSVEEEKKCSAKPSQYLPGKDVLNEGSGSMTLNIRIKKFLNNR